MNHNFYEIFFPNSLKFDNKEQLVKHCSDNSVRKKVAIDVGADMCEGLTNNLIKSNWSGKIYALDLWVMREPESNALVKYIKGNVEKTLDPTLKEINSAIDIVEIDLRNIHIDDDPYDLNPASDPFLLNKNNLLTYALDKCSTYFDKNTIILINDFHGYETEKFFTRDAATFSQWLSTKSKYNCIAHSDSASAWMLDGMYSFNDFKNFSEVYND
jgi:23S rRNA U2552 (ribose-2'-O)-methylase RlmE/FtsJ